LELFGSAASGDFDPRSSDVDLLVEFSPSQPMGPWLSNYFAFKAHLEKLLGHRVDLVMSGALKRPAFRAAVNQQRRLLYAA
jgi:predicted nucleotidyltransferase